jgi:methionine-rich copper-binding protein CopC
MSLTRRGFTLVLSLGVCLALDHRAAAHALVIEASPAIDSSVRGSEVDFVLRFNSRIDHDRSRLTLIGPDGVNRRLSVSRASPLDTLQANANGLAPGSYKLRWQVLAIDGHITRGDIPFRITPP